MDPQDKLEKTSLSDSPPLNECLMPLWVIMPRVFLAVAAIRLFICRAGKAWVDERRELTENGSIMSVGRLTSDILERPDSEETKTVHLSKMTNVVTHTHTNTQIKP